VSLTLKLALSSISGVGFGGLPTFGNREISTTIRLKDGETNILAGLIRDEERTTLAGVPGLSDLPLIGHLFASNHKQTQQTDIVLTLTPHIVRVLDLSESDLRPFLMGRDSGSAPTDLPALTPRDQQGDLPMVRDPTNPPPQTPEPPPFPQPLEPSVPGTATPVVPPRK
jgi:general secretion pathway protein D